MNKPSHQPLSHGVMLPHELKPEYPTTNSSFLAHLHLVAIQAPDKDDISGVHKGTIITNPRSDSDPFADLTFSCIVSWGKGELEAFGWDFEYRNVYSVDMQRAERMLAMLRKIRNAKLAFPVKPSGFAQFVTLLALKVGIKYMVTAEDEATEQSQHYPTGWYRIRPIRDAENYISHLVEGVREKYLPQTEAAR